MAQEGTAGRGKEAAPIAFKLTPEQGGSSSLGQSLGQSQEGRKRKEGREGERTCNSSHTAGHTGKGGTETGMPNTLEGSGWRKSRKKRKSGVLEMH